MKDGGTAFPSHGSMGEVAQQGMSLRDYFAAKAMQGMLAGTSWTESSVVNGDRLVESAFTIADHMLAERDK